MQPTTTKDHIEANPDKCGGKPCIAGTRIRVWEIYVWHELQGRSAEEIVHDFPQLTLADVHAALAYFWDHEAVIRQQMKAVEESVARMKAASGQGLLDRLRDSSADTDPVSS